jgi:hypothetical protein
MARDVSLRALRAARAFAGHEFSLSAWSIHTAQRSGVRGAASTYVPGTDGRLRDALMTINAVKDAHFSALLHDLAEWMKRPT